MRYLFSFVFICSLLMVRGQWLSGPDGLSFLSMTGYSMSQPDVFSFTGNPAALTRLSCPEAGVYGESRFMPSGIRLFSGALAYPSKAGHGGFFGSMARADKYREAEFGFVYALQLGSVVSLGSGFSIHSIRAPGYAVQRQYHSSLGILLKPDGPCRMGLYVRDPVGLSLSASSSSGNIPCFAFGMSYEPASYFNCSAEFSRRTGMPMQVSTLIQYALRDAFFLRCGFLSGSGSVYAGAGFRFHHMRMMIIMTYHPRLNVSSSLLINGRLNGKEI
jgi:hypothetical protein